MVGSGKLSVMLTVSEHALCSPCFSPDPSRLGLFCVVVDHFSLKEAGGEATRYAKTVTPFLAVAYLLAAFDWLR
jgi:hypothetical protein